VADDYDGDKDDIEGDDDDDNDDDDSSGLCEPLKGQQDATV
jgi:hypothetical protein